MSKNPLVTDLAEARKKREAVLKQQPVTVLPDEQQVVELLSIIYAPVSRSAFAACLNSVGIRTPEGRQFLPAHVEALLAPLIASRTVKQDHLGYQLRGDLQHKATLEAIAGNRFEKFATAVQLEIKPQGVYGGRPYYRTYAQSLRDVRIWLYRQNPMQTHIALQNCMQQFPDNAHPFLTLCTPFDADWAETLPFNLYLAIVGELLDESSNLKSPATLVFDSLERRFLASPENNTPFAREIYGSELIIRGRIADARNVASSGTSPSDLAIVAWTDFVAGDDESAINRYEQALTLLKKELGKRKLFFTTVAGLFFIPALIRSGSPENLQKAEEYTAFVTAKRDWNFKNVFTMFSLLLEARRGVSNAVKTVDNWCAQLVDVGGQFQRLFAILVANWVNSSIARELTGKALKSAKEIESFGYQYIADEIALTCGELGAGNSTTAAHGRIEAAAIVPLHNLIRSRSSWETALTALVELTKDKPAALAVVKSETRLIWTIAESERTGLVILPREQKLTAGKHSWSAGRVASLKKLKAQAGTLSHLTPRDREICAAIASERSYYYRSQEEYWIDPDQTLPLLIGHPLAFVDDLELLPLEIVAGEPELRAEKKGDKLLLTLHPQPDQGRCLHLWETRTRLKIIEISDSFRKVAEIIGEGLSIPAKAEARVLEALGAVSSLITVHSGIAGVAANVESRPSDPVPQILLTPYGSGLRLELKVRPLGEDGSFYPPGSGAANIISDIGGSRVQTKRDLRLEEKLSSAIIDRLPLLDAEEDGEGVWTFQDPASCLELLDALSTVTEEEGRVVWPEGEKLRITRQYGASQMKVSVRQAGDWFQLDGGVELDDGSILELKRLLELMQGRVGRFVPLGDGSFLTLTQQFRKRLEELQSFTDIHGKAVRCAIPAMVALEGFCDEVGEFTSDMGWQQQLQRLREAETLKPVLPSTLQAELRDYQRAGFDWLATLAHWSGGACLADDMGLGKTVQALALILTRAANGPTLVIAPTSVCMNWETEATRFAPTLNLLSFGQGNRQEMLEGLNPFDLVICSYGLLQQEGEMLTKVGWQTIVLDEAQAIKNMATKRSQAAMALQGGFRLITTGTPLENHLGELWNLFRFISPGLLGSHRSFSVRFATPIERDRDKGAKERLKKLIRPFILRRTKAQVLSELPPRTEIAIRVELSREEATFYEALRQSALEKIAESKGAEGEKRLRIFAEIMRLRRACCHPRLILPESPIEGSKLAACLELIEELLEGGHKALVFSQFIDHLDIVRKEVEKRKISYQYLDGSTTPQERRARVEAFQSGVGELFLISLKAGGVGLNLTAADYVIHLDPWWNPAVEDQASDRAHRIGQSRPVTVYRLVTAKTIEEKIIALHGTKRDLADSLLEGTESGARMTAEDMLALLKGV